MTAPYPTAGRTVPPVNPFPATILTGVTYDSGIIQSQGAGMLVCVKADQILTLSIIQYADAKGTIVLQTTTQASVANTLLQKAPTTVQLFGWFKITLANASGSTANIANLAILQ